MNNHAEIVRFNPDGIPQSLKMRHQWVCWQPRDRGSGKIDKIPIDPRTLRHAKTNDSSTWATFHKAKQAAHAQGMGVGFVFTEKDGLVGIDLDRCVRDDTIEPWAQKILETLKSYSEVTPSGTGLHVICAGKIPGKRRKNGKIEVYEHGRFFTVTGDSLNGSAITKAQDGLDSFYADHMADAVDEGVTGGDGGLYPTKPLNNRAEAILNRLKQNERFNMLMDGDATGYPSQSEADLALCCLLARETSDPAVMDDIFRRSGLMRDKWDRVHHSDGRTYGEGTIFEALKRVPCVGDDAGGGGKGKGERGMDIKTITTLVHTEFPAIPDVISGGILPEGGGLILAGEAGVGKSMLSLEIALHLATGRQLFDAKLLVPKKRRSLIMQCENPEPQVKKRILRMIKGLRIQVDDLGDRIGFADPTTTYDLLDTGCIEQIKNAVKGFNADVIILDPLSSFHGLEENDNSRMRRALDRITHISRETGCAAIVIHHYGKPQQGRDDEYRLRGASSIKDWADTIISLQKKKHEHRELFVVRFDKVRHGSRKKPFVCERTDDFLSRIVEEDVMITGKQVCEILRVEFGGVARTKAALVGALREAFDCGDSTARKAVDKAVEMKMVALQKAKGRAKKVVLVTGQR